MTIAAATKAQVRALRDNVEKIRYTLQVLDQGARRPARLSAAEVTAFDTLLGATNTALDAIIAAAVDVTPSAFSFTDVTGAATNTQYISNSITVAGINEGVDIAISVTGGFYSVNGGAFLNTPSTVKLGDTVRARANSASAGATAVNVAVTIGGVSDTYTVTTA